MAKLAMHLQCIGISSLCLGSLVGPNLWYVLLYPVTKVRNILCYDEAIYLMPTLLLRSLIRNFMLFLLLWVRSKAFFWMCQFYLSYDDYWAGSGRPEWVICINDSWMRHSQKQNTKSSVRPNKDWSNPTRIPTWYLK